MSGVMRSGREIEESDQRNICRGLVGNTRTWTVFKNKNFIETYFKYPTVHTF